MKQNGPEDLSTPEAKLLALGTPQEIIADRVRKLRISPDVAALQKNTRLTMPQFLGLIFEKLYKKDAQIKQRITEKLKDFNLTSEVIDDIFTHSSGEVSFFLYKNRDAISAEKVDQLQETVNEIMLQELKSYLF